MTALPLAEWRDFYVMIGTASGAIVGAAFVVATLASGLKERTVGIRGFITPSVVHRSSVLIGSAILTVPTLTPLSLAIILGAGGLGGVVYSVIAARRIWSMDLDSDDRVFYAIVPILTYAVMSLAALIVCWAVQITLNILAASLVTLLIIGMRNAWDMASFMIMRDPRA